MAESKWDKQLMDFLKRTTDELKRTGEELKGEAQRLMVEVRDPANQAKVKQSLEELRVWAARTSQEAAQKVETAMRRVEGAVEEALDPKQGEANKAAGTPPTGPAAPAAPAPSPAEPPKATAAPKAAKKAASKKSIGRPQQEAGARKSAGGAKTAKKAAPKKSLGRKKPSA